MVAPHSCHSGPRFERLPDRSGGAETILWHIFKGVPRDIVLSPKNLGNQNNCSSDPIGGGGCLGHLPPSLIMHSLHECSATKAKERRLHRGRRKDRPRTDQEKNPQNRKKQRKGLGANSGHKESLISHSPSTNAFRNIFSARFGIIGPYLKIAPLNGSAFHILMLHFCNLC